MINKIVLLIAGILCIQNICAQGFDAEKLDRYLHLLDSNNRFMGSVALSKGGKIIYSRAIGYEDVEQKQKATIETKYRIGSITKTFTAVLVMKAIELKKLQLNQHIDTFFPDLKNADKISIQHLLNHHSGIHNFTDDPDYLNWQTQPKTEQELLHIIGSKENDFEPGTKASYSNSNFVLLTFVLQKVFKKPYGTLLQDYIIKPLGLRNTYPGKKINPSGKEAASYVYDDGWKKEKETDMSIPLGAGSIVSTPGDLLLFAEALFGGKLVSKKSLALMETVTDHYGSGLFPIPFNDKKGYGHTGGIDGFSSVFMHFDDGDISFVLTSNGSRFNNNNISIAALSAAYNQPFELPQFSTYAPTEQELLQYVGVYVTQSMPLKIIVRKDGMKLIAQATGQSSFPLQPVAKNTFVFDQAGVKMEFNPASKTMLLTQGGAQYTFTAE